MSVFQNQNIGAWLISETFSLGGLFQPEVKHFAIMCPRQSIWKETQNKNKPYHASLLRGKHLQIHCASQLRSDRLRVTASICKVILQLAGMFSLKKKCSIRRRLLRCFLFLVFNGMYQTNSYKRTQIHRHTHAYGQVSAQFRS